jgi:NADH-quinone oxidoreductase subunit A
LPTTLTQDWGPVFLIVGFAVFVAVAMYALATWLGPKKPSALKDEPYESGSPSTGAQGLRLPVKFYLPAILFVIFDVEAIFLYPWAVLFRTLGWAGLVEMIVFLGLLVVALVYVWRKGALEWES